MQKRNKDKSRGGEATARRASVTRRTKETAISAAVDLDGTGAYDVATGVGFLDHMIEQLARHSLIDITISTSTSTTPPKTPALFSARPWHRRSGTRRASRATALPICLWTKP
jgi:hypothetical protein